MQIYHLNGKFYNSDFGGIPEGAAPITPEEYAQMRAALAVPERPTRGQLLADLCQRIDAKTDAEILTGFEFKGSNFKLSLENQFNFKTESELRDSLKYPHRVKTLTGYYDFADAAEYHLFYLAGVSYIRSLLVAGWAQKDALSNLTDDELWQLFNQ